MFTNFLLHFLKFIILYYCIGYSYLRIVGIKGKFFPICITSLLLSISTSILQEYVSYLTTFIAHCFIYNFILSKITQKEFGYSLILLIISVCISIIDFTISSGISAGIWAFILKQNSINFVVILFTDIIEVTLLFLLFKVKRLRHGFPYFTQKSNSDYIDIFIILLCTFVIFIYFILTLHSRESIQYMYIWLILFSIIFIIIVRKAFILYHKQKLQLQALKSYEQELSETKEKLAIAIEEKQKLIKSNHEFYHRQESLNKKLDDLMKRNKLSSNLNMNTEFAEDYSDILERINKLSDEYKAKTATIPNLEKTGITEIDDMLSYMQSECIKSNIEFNLKINCDVHYMIEKLISVSQLETLLGDLIRNSIIAINHSSKDFRSILVVFGIKDKIYELCVFDSGIPFEIDTLLNLGIKPASTHLDEGGSGIGFVTTFETMDSCNSSFVINEITNNNYTKSLEIKFDNLNEYIVVSDRKDEIAKKNAINKRNDIILK